MSYTKTTWTDGATALSAQNMNHIENGIADVDSGLTTLSGTVSSHTSSIATINTNMSNKVDKVSGKGLSTNDFTNDYKTKLTNIAAGAEVNQNAFSKVKVGSNTINSASKTDTLTIVGAGAVAVNADTSNKKVTITGLTPYTDYIVAQSWNASGRYRKWNSGLLEQWVTATASANSGYAQKTFPVTFADNSVGITASVEYKSGYPAYMVSVQANATTATVYVRANGNTNPTVDTTAYIYAWGTWS